MPVRDGAVDRTPIQPTNDVLEELECRRRPPTWRHWRASRGAFTMLVRHQWRAGIALMQGDPAGPRPQVSGGRGTSERPK